MIFAFKEKSNSTTESSQSIASNLIANNSINLASGNGDINIIGSNVSSTNSDINLNSMLGNINIEAGESTYSQSSKSNSRNLGGSIGTNGLSANIGFNESQNSLDQTTFANSQISAINGNLNINTKQDLKIFGANLLSKNVNLNIGNNFLLKSRQNLSESDSYNIGASIGISGDSSGVNGGSLGLNLGNGYSNKAMVEDISSIIGNNSVNINVANDTNIAGALIANQNNQGIDLGNLNLKTKSLTYSDLNNFSVSESNQLSTNLQAGYNPNNPTQNGNLAIKLNMQGKESSSTTKATIGKGNITINEILNDESKIANLNREINNIEQNKQNIITSDFDSEIKIDLRLIASVGNLMIGDTDKAVANWNSYATETKKGFNISYDALAIPLNSLGETVSGDLNASDALLATGKNYQNLYQLAYNQNIVLEDLAGEGKLITYSGDQLDATSESKYANGFYDRNSDTAVINSDSNKSDSILAGTLAHEGGHRMFNNIGQSYTLSEENASHMIGNFAESRWDTYQSDNTSLRDSLPTPTLNFSNNFYANNVEFGVEVNPLLHVVIPTLATAYFAYKGEGNALKGMSDTNRALMNSDAGKAIGKVADTAITGADVVTNKLGAEEGSTPVRDALNTAEKSYDKYVPQDVKEFAEAFGLTTTVLGAGILGRRLLRGTELEIGGAVAVSNTVPDRMARVIHSEYSGTNTLGHYNAKDVFVTASSDVSNITNSTQLATKLSLFDNGGNLIKGPFTIIEFDTPASGISSPIFRSNPGFVSPGTGKTAGGAREFSIPNLEINNLNNVTKRSVQ